MSITHIQRSALLPFRQEDLFAMVADVRVYPQFLPWCNSIDVLSETAEVVEARVTAGAAGVSQSFVTRNQMTAFDSIELSLVEGPFEHFEGRWDFIALGDASVSGAKLQLDMRFELARQNPLLRRTFGALFERATATLVTSFCERAQTLYGGAVS